MITAVKFLEWVFNEKYIQLPKECGENGGKFYTIQWWRKDKEIVFHTTSNINTFFDCPYKALECGLLEFLKSKQNL
jgi:hypothetical protein